MLIRSTLDDRVGDKEFVTGLVLPVLRCLLLQPFYNL